MANHRGTSGAKTRKSLFESKDRLALLRQAMGEPTGTIITIGGVEFDLVPLSTADGTELLELVDVFQDAITRARAEGGLKDDEGLKLITSNGGRVMNLMKTALRDAAFLDGSPEQDELFDEWFAKLPLLPTLRALLPATMQANGLTRLIAGNARPPAAQVTPAATEQPSTTSSATS